MPRKRNEENKGLPLRWRIYHGSYYYHVPPGMEKYWDHRRQYRLGSTLEEAMQEYLRRLGAPCLAKDVSPSQLLTAEQIVDGARGGPFAGVYFLLDGDEIVYVGRSDNIFARVGNHVNGDMTFNGVYWVPAAGLDQVRLEQLYVGRFAPKYNTYLAANSTP